MCVPPSGLGRTAGHRHFIEFKGSSIVIYGDTGKASPLITLVGVDLATAEAHRSAFVIGL